MYWYSQMVGHGRHVHCHGMAVHAIPRALGHCAVATVAAFEVINAASAVQTRGRGAGAAGGHATRRAAEVMVDLAHDVVDIFALQQAVAELDGDRRCRRWGWQRWWRLSGLWRPWLLAREGGRGATALKQIIPC